MDVQDLKLTYDSRQDALLVSWSWSGAGDGFEVLLFDRSGALEQPQPSVRLQSSGSSFTATLTGPMIQAGRGHRVRVFALTDPAFAVTLVALPAPTGLDATFDGAVARLFVTWDPVPGADGYSVDASPPLSPPVVSKGSTSLEIDATGLDNGSNVVVSVVASSTGLGRSRPAELSFTALLLSAPGLPRVTDESAAIGVEWNSVLNAEGYEVRIGQGTEPLDPQPAIEVSLTNARIDGATLTRGSSYWVQVRGTAAHVVGAWSGQSPTSYHGGETAQQLATRLFTSGLDVFDVAAALHAAFGSSLDAAGMASTLAAASTSATLVRLAIALARSGYAIEDTAAALLAVAPRSSAGELAHDLDVAYPPPAIVAELRDGITGAELATAARALRQRHDRIDALRMAVLVILVVPAVTAVDMARAIAACTLDLNEIAIAVRTLRPNITAPDLGVALIRANLP